MNFDRSVYMLNVYVTFDIDPISITGHAVLTVYYQEALAFD